MRFIIAVCMSARGGRYISVTGPPDINSQQLQALTARYGKEALERVQSLRYLIEARKSPPAAAQLAAASDYSNRLVFEDVGVRRAENNNNAVSN